MLVVIILCIFSFAMLRRLTCKILLTSEWRHIITKNVLHIRCIKSFIVKRCRSSSFICNLYFIFWNPVCIYIKFSEFSRYKQRLSSVEASHLQFYTARENRFSILFRSSFSISEITKSNTAVDLLKYRLTLDFRQYTRKCDVPTEVRIVVFSCLGSYTCVFSPITQSLRTFGRRD